MSAGRPFTVWEAIRNENERHSCAYVVQIPWPNEVAKARMGDHRNAEQTVDAFRRELRLTIKRVGIVNFVLIIFTNRKRQLNQSVEYELE